MKNTRTALLVLASAVLAAVAGAVAGQESELTYSGSLQAASGDYTLSETTRTVLLFSGLSYRRGKWSLSATLPWIDQDSPYVAYVGGTPVPSGRRQGVEPEGGGNGGSNGSGMGHGGTVIVPDPETLDFDESGVGDLVARGDFAVWEDQAARLRFGVYGAAKAPIASEDSGFGTGEWDYGAGITLSKTVGSTLLLADFGYWVFGDLPGFELQDPFAYSLGLGRALTSGRYSLLGTLSGMTEIVAGADGPAQAGITVSRLLGSSRSFSVTVAAGLSESSPDVSVSAGWRVGI